MIINKVMRMWKMKLFIPILLSALLPAVLSADSRLTNVGTTSAAFLEVGIGSRAIGMGGAFVATVNDVSALYWNPAGLTRIGNSEAMFERVEWLAGISYNFIGVSLPVFGRGTGGFFLNSMTVPFEDVRTVDYPDGTGEKYDAASISVGLSYAFSLTDRFSIGCNVKFVQERIWHEKANGIAIDIGTLYQTGIRGLRIGAAITNFGTSLQLDGSDVIDYIDVDPSIEGNNDRIMAKLLTDEWPLPLNMQFGIAYDFITSPIAKATLAVDAFHPINNTESVNTGMEITFFNTLCGRVGYKAIGQQDTEEGLTIGGGLRYRLFGKSYIKVDYAYADFGRLKNVDRYTLQLEF